MRFIDETLASNLESKMYLKIMHMYQRSVEQNLMVYT